MNLRLPCRLLPVLALAALGARLAAADDTPVPGRVVELPPLTVAEASNGPPWRYVEIPGLEVLSRCNDEVTVHLVQEMHRLEQLVRVILPENLQVKMAVPTVAVLYSEENKPVVSQEVVAELRASDRGSGGEGRRAGGEVRYRSLPNLRLTDRDAMDFFIIVEEKDFARSRLLMTSDYIRYVVRNRTPAPPAWFVDGITDLFEQADFDRNPVTFNPVQWASPADTKKIKKDPDYPRALLPIQELFSVGPETEQRAALRRAEAVLFLRWAFDGENGTRREAMWKFVARASAAPATEEMFRDCFGLGYVDVLERISDYLPDAVDGTVHVAPEKPAALPRLEPRLATELEIARIKGDWERLEIGYVKTRYPELASKYVDQARRTLMRAYDKGERDPRLLAVIGLCECDAGNGAGARQYLEAAVQGGVVRPRANYELARLRYAEAQKAPAAPDGRLSPAQATSVLQPLSVAWRQPPPLLEIYALTAEVWSRSAPALTRQNLAVLDEGVAYFPHNAPLIYQAAWLNARQGFKSESEALIARGLQAGPDTAVLTRFEKLRAILASAQQTATPP